MSPDTSGDSAAEINAPGTSDEHAVTPATLRDLTDDLDAGDLDAPETLKQVWAGLCVARLLGLRLAATGLSRLQGNAESVEHQLAGDLATTATFAHDRLALPSPASPEPLAADQVDDALEALIAFSATARRRMLATARLATQWHDERVLRHDSLVMGELAAAWLGHRTSYRLDRRPEAP
ncbi:hypothetical protein ABZ816_10475 [Actinosynnema sp. NPDC047251]|uniref:Uncharacterized protein n=1 Tax=Saccharothrix espanaensis (strain ATCC 51144 / DSM 44229 / JCM 9112 / NBRC 15066 / NRRL 15764) TaxID=1179773 RepID=K0KCA5_SACES|nr:hypothetical protein [Saccharothrix espanaensis]CCH34238.1 hypothetical protein BN6_70020 [Saccharothrix espanaensis DSM 44229]